MKTPKIVWTILILSWVSSAAWVEYQTFDGYIPSYTYPITLNTGDQIDATLSWPGAQDLDLFLYQDSTDLLGSTSLDMQFSPTNNPQQLIFTVTYSGVYYLRVDLFTSVPTSYQFQIKINGVVLETHYDTVISVSSGRTAKQFMTTVSCSIKIEYDGPIYPIYLYEPAEDVISGTAYASNTSNVNPKDLTASLTTTGIYSIIIHHSLASAYVLVPFSIVVYTDDANPCQNFCTNIAYAKSLYPGQTSTCICQDGFTWNSGGPSCQIICSEIADTVTRVADHECSCSGGLVWSSSQLACGIDCSAIAHASGLDPSSSGACTCDTKYYWDAGSSTCKLDCSAISYNSGTSGDELSCLCDTDFVWSAADEQCAVVCENLPDTVGARTAVHTCACRTKYSWSGTNMMCEIDCSALSYSAGNIDASSCNCDAKFVWTQADEQCEIDCGSLSHSADSTSLVSSGVYDECSCSTKYSWSAADLQCAIDCGSLSYTAGAVGGVFDQCLCVAKFVWDATDEQCVIDCSSLSNALQVVGSYDTCDCTGLYLWSSVDLQCQGCDVTCVCSGYYPLGFGNAGTMADLCSSVCGDGYVRLLQQCDDGNTNDNDGCASTCLVEVDFTCANQPSQCSYNGIITVSVASYDRTGCNSFKASLKLTPVLGIYKYANFNPYFAFQTAGLAFTSMEYAGQGYLAATFDVVADVNQTTVVIVSQVYGLPAQYTSFTFEPVILPVRYSQSECSTADSMDKLVSGMFIISAITLVLSMSTLSNKIIGIELFGLLQLAYFNLANHYSSININLYPLTKLSLSNGPRVLMFDQTAEKFYSHLPVIAHDSLELNGYFINNFNIMFMILVVVALSCLAVCYFAKNAKSSKIVNLDQQSSINLDRRKSRQSHSKVAEYADKIGKQATLTILLFCLLQISFSAGIFEVYVQPYSPTNAAALALSYICLILIFVLTIGLTYHLLSSGIHEDGYGDYKTSFMRNPVCRLYIPLTIIYRIAIGLYISIEQDYQLGTLLVISFSLIFLLVMITNLPFTSALHNYRSNLIHITQLSILIVTNYYRSMKMNSPMTQKSHYHTAALFEIVMICVCVIFSLFLAVLETVQSIIKLIKERKTKTHINKQTKIQSTEQGQINETNEDLAEKEVPQNNQDDSRRQISGSKIDYLYLG